MRGVDMELQGFDPEERDLPTPVIAVGEETQARLLKIVASITQGATPEEIATGLEDGFPNSINEQLRRPLEFDELTAYVNLLIATLQTPA